MSQPTKKPLVRLFWESRSNPNDRGEIRPVHSEKLAQRICEWSDSLFPRFKHTYKAQ